MATLHLERVAYRGTAHYPQVEDVTLSVAFGTAQLVVGRTRASTIVRLIGGALEPDQGTVEKDGHSYPSSERTDDSWFVRESVVKPRWLIWSTPTVQSQVRYGLTHTPNPRFRTEAEVMERFHLSPLRMNRPITSLSSEAWRASCAIGLVNGKTIFCFPFIPADYIENYYQAWFRDLIDILRSFHTLVLLPTEVTSVTQQLCDAVVEL